MLFGWGWPIYRSAFCAVVVLVGCGGGPSGVSSGASSGGSGAGAGGATCSSSAPLQGASYDIAKSRFAFGSTPSAEEAGSFVRWVGTDGVVAISPHGSELGIMNANAPESALPDWSTDPSKLSAHVIAYWVSMGVETCQIASAGFLGSVSGGGSIDGGFTQTTGPTDIPLERGINGVPVAESLAVARFNVNDQTTFEAFYWPEIPAEVVGAAVTFANQLSDPAGLAAYKAKLPADAQGQGQVLIHHTSAGSSSLFQAAVTYDVVQTVPPSDSGGISLGGEEDLSFDPNGNPVTTAW
jgi:hypothetical protein